MNNEIKTPFFNFRYKVERPILWFAKDQIIDRKKLNEYFTEKAIGSLLEDGFISHAKLGTGTIYID
jgi:hypothetical protein